MATAVSNWEERKEKDNTTFRLVSLTSMLVVNEDLLKEKPTKMIDF